MMSGIKRCSKCKIDKPIEEFYDRDHCHNSGQVRKLLCQSCNKGLGFFRDSVEFLDKAKEYLEECQLKIS